MDTWFLRMGPWICPRSAWLSSVRARSRGKNFLTRRRRLVLLWSTWTFQAAGSCFCDRRICRQNGLGVVPYSIKHKIHYRTIHVRNDRFTCSTSPNNVFEPGGPRWRRRSPGPTRGKGRCAMSRRKRRDVPIMLLWSRAEQRRFVDAVERLVGAIGDLEQILAPRKRKRSLVAPLADPPLVVPVVPNQVEG